jgi:diphthine synthase
MALYFVGLGLNDEKDITLKGLEVVKRADIVYLECYTSKLNAPLNSLEKLYGKKITKADRNLVENEPEKTILREAREKDVAFLVVGDAMAATTHIDLLLRAKRLGVKTRVIHNASVLTAVGITGLELYKFGKTTSIPFNNENVKSPIEVLRNNQKLGLHTLFLLDLDPEKGKFLAVSEAAAYLIRNGVSKETKAVACASLGSDNPFIKFRVLAEISKLRITKVPQCLIIPSKLHFIEEEALSSFA